MDLSVRDDHPLTRHRRMSCSRSASRSEGRSRRSSRRKRRRSSRRSRRQSDCPEYPPAVAPAPMPMQQGTPAWIIPIYILMGLLLLVGVIIVLGLTFGWFNSGSQTRQAQVRAQKRKRSTGAGAKQTTEDLRALCRGGQTRTRGTQSKPRCIDGLELPEMCRGTMIGATLCVAIIINALILFLIRQERQKREMVMMWGGYGQPQV